MDRNLDSGYVFNVTLIEVMTYPWVMDNNRAKDYPQPTSQYEEIAWTPIWLCVHCDLWDMTLGRGQDTSMGHRQLLCEFLSRSKNAVWRGCGFWLCVLHCDFNHRDVTLDQVHDTSLGHGQHLCEIFVSECQCGLLVWRRSWGQSVTYFCLLWIHPLANLAKLFTPVENQKHIIPAKFCKHPPSGVPFLYQINDF